MNPIMHPTPTLIPPVSDAWRTPNATKCDRCGRYLHAQHHPLIVLINHTRDCHG